MIRSIMEMVFLDTSEDTWNITIDGKRSIKAVNKINKTKSRKDTKHPNGTLNNKSILRRNVKLLLE